MLGRCFKITLKKTDLFRRFCKKLLYIIPLQKFVAIDP